MSIFAADCKEKASRGKQGKLRLESKKAPKRSRAADFSAANMESAEIILADPERHGGDGSLPVEWARGILAAGARA